jgi:hypothetical protein
VIVDGGEIRLGAMTDLPHRCGAKASCSKHFTSRLEQALARFRPGGIGADAFHASNLRFKHLYETKI